jgi:hypothetical protein
MGTDTFHLQDIQSSNIVSKTACSFMCNASSPIRRKMRTDSTLLTDSTALSVSLLSTDGKKALCEKDLNCISMGSLGEIFFFSSLREKNFN